MEERWRGGEESGKGGRGGREMGRRRRVEEMREERKGKEKRGEEKRREERRGGERGEEGPDVTLSEGVEDVPVSSSCLPRKPPVWAPNQDPAAWLDPGPAATPPQAQGHALCPNTNTAPQSSRYYFMIFRLQQVRLGRCRAGYAKIVCSMIDSVHAEWIKRAV